MLAGPEIATLGTRTSLSEWNYYQQVRYKVSAHLICIDTRILTILVWNLKLPTRTNSVSKRFHYCTDALNSKTNYVHRWPSLTRYFRSYSLIFILLAILGYHSDFILFLYCNSVCPSCLPFFSSTPILPLISFTRTYSFHYSIKFTYIILSSSFLGLGKKQQVLFRFW